jgi:predicted GNAT family N-acyltransferase
MPTEFEIRIAQWPQDRERLAGIREKVFVEEQGIPLALEWDGRDAEALHLLALDSNGKPVGTVRMLRDGHIGRLAVLPVARGRGIGSALLRHMLRLVRDRGYPSPFLNAQTAAIPFYRRFSFVSVGPEFLDAGIPHRRMHYPGRC